MSHASRNQWSTVLTPAEELFSSALWTPALEKYSSVTNLTARIYGSDGRIALGPVGLTPLFQLFDHCGYDPGIFAECARRCLTPSETRPVIVSRFHGLTVVGTPLVLAGKIIGAAVGGYVLADFSQVSEIQLLAREADIAFDRVWEVTRTMQPMPQRRLIVNGELLAVLGDTLLRENYRTRQYEQTAAELRKAVAAKDEFMAVLSHELRNPLTPILGWARMLKRSPDTAMISHAAEVIERNVYMQLRLVDDLLDLNLVQRGKMSLNLAAHDLGALLRRVMENVQEQAQKKKIGISLAAPEGPLPVKGDDERLQQVLTNILDNAVKFTPEGGSIQVELARDGASAVVKIRDTGEGITPEFLPFAFEMFRQQAGGNARRHSGMGIGLALAKRFIELHDGAIEIASQGAGQGTEVTLRLPAAADASVPRNSDGAASPSSPLQGLSILLVEDSEDTRQLTEHMLQTMGAQVLAASSAPEALEVMAATVPDVVLCDLCMPGMDGFEFMRRLNGRPHPPVIAVSGLAGRLDHERTRAAGFEGHLNKPFDDISLVSAITRARGQLT